ncbi:hypothetical protein G1H10_04850 [Phytoactinopolyspora halotolerans]|uniref:D-serine dehydratase-like domain-containing protein n=2 Tax=Phytoactinopolyspora halotolerans TaxID=1981512 RepID=A0A6L9S3T0_9ACTN|nr:hypothetical protein [Phytoactinopolyspora halotolerans]
MNGDDEWLIDWRCKSFPPLAEGTPASQIGEAKWDLLTDFTTPVAALQESALAHNLDRMRSYCAEHGVRIAPHGKTTMSPELIRRQLEHGAWAMTAATAWQARAMLTFGVPRVIIANECIDPVGLQWIVHYMWVNRDAEVYVFVDSIDAVEAMRTAIQESVARARRPRNLSSATPSELATSATDGARSMLDRISAPSGDPASGGFPGFPGFPPVARPIPVLVEVGVVGGRAGVRDVSTAVAVGRAVAHAPELELAGVGCFEGVLGGRRVPEVVEPVREFLRTTRRVGEELMDADAFRAERPVILTAGGSAFFDQVVDVFTADREQYRRPVEVVIRSGCYVTHDHSTYREASPFRSAGESDFVPAMQVWSRVLSTPEPGLAIIDAGKRDISTDARMPLVLGRWRDGVYQPFGDGTGDDDAGGAASVIVDRFNDQHGYVQMTGAGTPPLRVGDLVALGISHPCTTFDKWRVIPVVDDERHVVGAVRTFF